MKHSISLPLVGLATLFLASAGNAQNLIQNPGFESGSLSPWFQSRNFGGSESWNVTSASAHSGTFSATGVGNEEIRQNITPTAANTITEVSFWAEHPNASVSAIAFDLFYTDGTDNEFLVSTSGTNYNFFNVTSDLNTTKVLDGFSIFGNSAGRTYVDDVRIMAPSTATPEPGTYAMVASLGLSGAVFLRRRRAR